MSSQTSTERAKQRRTERRREVAARHQERVAIVAEHAGTDLRNAVRVHWKKATFTTWEEALIAFAGGITIELYCDGTNRQRWVHHRIHIASDGSVAALDHDQLIDPDAERFLVGLGGQICACVAAAAFLPSPPPLPSGLPSWRRSLENPVRALHTMVAWAQEEDVEWSPEFGESVLRFGITPAVLSEWLEAGWEQPLALRFLQRGVSRELATRWRDHGDVTARAAALAARGEEPDAERQWTDVGFTRSRSLRWRKSGLTPAEAYLWDSHKVAPTMVESLRRNAVDLGVEEQVLRDWCRAGVSSNRVCMWFAKTAGDLGEALRWQSKHVDPTVYATFEQWNRTAGRRALSAEQVSAYLAVGFPRRNPEVMAQAVDHGVSPDDYRAAVDSLREGSDPVLLQWLLQQRPQDRSEDAWWRFDQSDVQGWVFDTLERGTSPVIPHLVRYLCAERPSVS